jgi:hypothetical protein
MSLDEMVKRYVVTTAQKGATINKGFYDNLKNYCQVNKAELLILPTSGKSILDEEVGLHPDLQQHSIITTEYKLNNSIRISNYALKPQQILPLTGLKRFAQGDKSFIFASTKQQLQYVANSYDLIPKAIMTTGSITNPRYNENNRIGRIATKDHEIGAIIVEIEDSKYFHHRYIKANKKGDFYDLGIPYTNNKKEGQIPYLIMGDLHPHHTDPKHYKLTIKQLKELKPENLVLHDAFNGVSISHHYKGKLIEQNKVYLSQGLNLEKELRETVKSINGLAEHVDTVYIVKSNHDEHLERYLQEGRFIEDVPNQKVGAELFLEALQGKDPLQVGLQRYGLANNVVLLQRDDNLKYKNVQLGNHGDLGANGGRASPRSIEEANGSSVTGHTHTVIKLRDTYSVGTSTYPRIGYNRGYSNWVQANAIINIDGSIQILNNIKGKYKL